MGSKLYAKTKKAGWKIPAVDMLTGSRVCLSVEEPVPAERLKQPSPAGHDAILYMDNQNYQVHSHNLEFRQAEKIIVATRWTGQPEFKIMYFREWAEAVRFAYQLSEFLGQEIRLSNDHFESNGHYFHYKRGVGVPL